MISLKRKMKVFVAMSGGVDSSTTAGLLKKAGYTVVGVTMCFNISHPNSQRPSCCGIEGIEDARRAARILDIPHYVLNFASEINDFIIDDFTQEYLAGRTPNPCVRCNQYLKFGTLYKKVRALGADFLATGHYVRLGYNSRRKTWDLKKAKDPSKDQSYFLYGIDEKILPRLLFPLGPYTKDEVRGLARKFGLPAADKPESQDICFVPDRDYKKFIRERLGNGAFVPGPFKDPQGKILGQHQGIIHYTIGQRERLGLALGYPVYVYKIDKRSNTVYVGKEENLYSAGLVAGQLNYFAKAIPKKGMNAEARIRYHAPEIKAKLIALSRQRVEVIFKEPQKAVTPGQSVVFYQRDKVLGGAVIEKAIGELRHRS